MGLFGTLHVRMRLTILKVQKKSQKLLRFIIKELEDDHQISHVSEIALQKVVIQESEKTYLTKSVDLDNKENFFKGYASLYVATAEFVKNKL